MRWFRPDSGPIDESALTEIGRMLEAAASEAPPSPRFEEVRATVLDGATAHRPGLALLRPVAVLAVVLLVFAAAVTAPVVGSLIVDSLDRTLPALPAPSAEVNPVDTDDTVDVPRVPPSAEAVASPAPTPAPQADGSDDAAPVETARPADEDEPPDSGPPNPLPTPPATGPPPVVPPTPGG